MSILKNAKKIHENKPGESTIKKHNFGNNVDGTSSIVVSGRMLWYLLFISQNHPATIYSILYEKHVAADIKTKIFFLLFLRFTTSMAYAFTITKIPWLMKMKKWATLCALERLCCEFYFFRKQFKVNGSFYRFVIIC